MLCITRALCCQLGQTASSVILPKVWANGNSVIYISAWLHNHSIFTKQWKKTSKIHTTCSYFWGVHNCPLCLQNLLEKSAEKETRQEYALAMIQCKVLKQLENLEQQKYDDEDITEDIKFLLDKLGESVQDLRCSQSRHQEFHSHPLARPGICVA